MLINSTLLLLSTNLALLPTHENQETVEEIFQNYQQQPQHELPFNRRLLNNDVDEEDVVVESDIVTSENILDGFSYDPRVNFRAVS